MDLSALKNPPSAASRAEIAGVDVTKESLMRDLLPSSNEQVVILICWSPRSLESKKVMSTLGKLHSEDSVAAQGRDPGSNAGWLLANVNVDTQVEVAQALQVQAVPFAIAIIQEQLVPLFETVPTDAQLRTVIDKVISLAAERGVGTVRDAGAGADQEVSSEEKLEPEELAALAALEKSDYAGAKVAYQQWLNRSPGNMLATLGLAQVELLLRIDELDLSDTIVSADAERDNIELQIQAADCEIAQGNFTAAFDRLISTIKNCSSDDGKDERKRVQSHLVGLFLLVDPSEPELKSARQRLASALF
jgi:putative thioredoxin